MATKNQTKNESLEKYIALVRRLGRVPTNAELNRYGPTLNKTKHHWGSFEKLDAAARKAEPDAFKDVLVKPSRGRLPRARRYVITTAVAGAPVNVPFLRSLQRYCKEHDAQLGIMICEDPAANVTRRGHLSVDRILAGIPVIGQNTELNRNLQIISLKASAKQIDPTTGTLRLGARGRSCIFASPKQRLRFVPTAGAYPHVVMTPGAVTLPAYETERYFSLRTAYLAHEDHICGAIIVEIEDPVRFHFRQVQADSDGSIVDMGRRYREKGRIERVRPTIVWGDVHAGQEEEAHEEARYRLCRELKPTRQVVHDLYPGEAISHHMEGKLLSKARMHEDLNLEKEIAITRGVLGKMVKRSPVTVVRSNHDEFLTRYLNSGRFMNEPQNVEKALELALVMVRGGDPVEHAIGMDGCTFLRRDESFKVEGLECGQHGDQGANGGPSSLKGFESSLGPCIVGHSHTPEILRMAWRTGTCTRLRMGYNQGPSSWCNSHILVYPGGLRQMVNVIDGYYRAQKD